jgi:hypothetical protein
MGAVDMKDSATVDEKPFVLRLPGDLKATLERLARLEDRSLNAQIVRVLREWAAPRTTGLRDAED